MTSQAVELAAAQLEDLEALSDGALEILDRPDGDGGVGGFVISIETGVNGSGAGVRVRARERFRILVTETFPFEPPSVLVEHRRWAHSRHVNWGNVLCLYAAPSVEWIPADGMRGLVDRLLTWLGHAAAGTLDPDGQPLHPPVAFPTAPGCTVVEPNLGDRVPWAGGASSGVALQFAWCVRDGDRIDVLAWFTADQVVARANSERASPTNPQGKRYFVALNVLLSEELGWEYPATAADLAERLSRVGYPHEALLGDLAWTSQANQVLRSRGSTNSDRDPVVVLLGTPSRRIAGSTRLAHLVAWKLDQRGEDIAGLLARPPGTFTKKIDQQLQATARRWLDTADVRWMRVFDQRTEITQRRDDRTAASWLRRARVLVLGCGALGAPVAEYCVRAGAQRVTVLDRGVVTPGILVRQPYSDGDIGQFKAAALAVRLNAITRKGTVRSVVGNAIEFVLGDLDPTVFDLIVDATADSGTRAALERAHRTRSSSRGPWPPAVTMIIGHQADLGLVTVARAGATGTGHDILRRVLLRARRTGMPEWQDVIADFFPDPPRSGMFFPEPGCSEPTFVGSAADVTALAAGLFTAAVEDLAAEQAGEATMSAIAVRRPRVTNARRHVAEALAWPNGVVRTDPGTGYDVRISAEAMAEIRAEVRRGRRVRGRDIETGGMVLGAIDESTGVVSVDLATGPAPDSKLSSSYFLHGTTGTQELIDHYARRTGGITGFLGFWHTHPGGPAAPSPTDKAGMTALTTLAGTADKALMVILGGSSQVWTAWTEGDGQPDVYVRVVTRDPAAISSGATSREPAIPPPGTYFAGGFSTAPGGVPVRQRRRWLWWGKR
ncbi:ThiF family adenylyltransferase [Amycolatopsis sp. NPDC004772]